MYLGTHYVCAKFRPDLTPNVATRGRYTKICYHHFQANSDS